MRRFAGLLLAATLGGTVSIGINHLIKEEQNQPVANNEAIKEVQSSQEQLVKLTKLAAETHTDFTHAAKNSLDGVVHVKTAYLNHDDQYYMDPLRQFFYGYGNGYQPKPQQKMASGSGVIISADGYIVTNNHVIKDAESIELTTNNGKSYAAELIGSDPTTDLALLKIDAEDLPYVPYGNSDHLEVGEWVLAVGNPFNLNSTVTAGIVSAKGRDINILKNDRLNGLPAVESFIQTDAAVNPGNSGGALVATTGELVGINTAIKSNTGSYTGYSFAIPVNIVRKVVDDLLQYGAVQRAFIGISIQNLSKEIATENGIQEYGGVYVAGLAKEGAAIDAGIEEGDIITKVGNVSVTKVPELQEQVSKFRPGDEILVTLKRAGKERTVRVTLKNKDGNTRIVPKVNNKIANALGASFEQIKKNEGKELGIDNGLKITQLKGGKLRSAGIREGFIITKVDKKQINDYNDLFQAIEGKKGGVLVEGIYPNGRRVYYGLGM